MWKELVKRKYIQTEYELNINGRLYGSDVIKEFPKYKHLSSSYIGGFPSKTCAFSIYDRNNSMNINKEDVVTIVKKYKINDNWQSIVIGKFIITNITTNITEKSITLTATDFSKKFDVNYIKKISFENEMHSGLEIINEICKQVGVELEGSFKCHNVNFKEPNINNKTSCRELISRMAELGGEIALINSEGKLIFKRPTEKDITIKQEHRIEYTKEKPKPRISRIALGKKGINDDYIKGENTEGFTTYRIEDNPYIDLYRADYGDVVLNNLINLNYTEFNVQGFIGGDFLEINDVVKLENNDGSVEKIIILNIENDGSFRSNIFANDIENKKSNYTIAGSTRQSIEETKLEVNHIKQEINSIIIKTNETNSRLEKETSELKQNFSGFNYAISKLGGENLLKNSIMLDMDNNIPKNWTLEEGGSLITEVDAHASERGAVTGNVFILNGKTIRQRIEVKKHTDINKVKYSFSTRIKKGYVGRCYIKIFNDLEQHIIEVPDSTKKDYEEFSIEGLTPKTDYYIIEFYSDSGTNTRFTDNMFVLSERKQSWKQANGESNAKMVNITNEGIIVKTDKQDENYKITNVGITGYGKENGQVVEKVIINSDKIYGEKLGARSGLSIPPLQIVPIFNNENLGWAIVETPIDRR